MCIMDLVLRIGDVDLQGTCNSIELIVVEFVVNGQSNPKFLYRGTGTLIRCTTRLRTRLRIRLTGFGGTPW